MRGPRAFKMGRDESALQASDRALDRIRPCRHEIVAWEEITFWSAIARGEDGGSPGRIRTSDQPVNSRLLYR